MLTFFLALGAMLMYSASGLFMKEYQLKIGSGSFQLTFMNTVLSGSVLAAFLIAKGFTFHFSTVTLVTAIAVGILLFIYNNIKVKAFQNGPVAITSMSFVLGGVLVPALYGFIFLGEPVVLHKIVGIVLVFASFLPLIYQSRHQMTFNKLFWVLCAVLLLFNGCILTLMKVSQLNSDPEYSMDYIGLYYFFFFLAANAAFIKEMHRPAEQVVTGTIRSRAFLVAMAVGLTNALGAVLNFLVSFRLPASVTFPLIQSGLLVCNTVLSMLLFREKPSKATLMSLAISIAALVLISV